MRAAIYRGPGDLRIERVPVPRIRPSELLVKVIVCGVCPTDIKKIQYGTVPPPRIFGHETAGVVVKMGAQVRGFTVGDRVALHHHVPCLNCHACRHRAYAQCDQYKRTGITAGFEPAGGGFANYVRVMPFVLPGVVRIPHRNSFEEGAMLEPVNTVLKAVRRLCLLPGDTVLVAGQGPIGLMFTRILCLMNVKVLATDFLDARLMLAREFGATWTLKPEDGGRKAEDGGRRTESRGQRPIERRGNSGRRDPESAPPHQSSALCPPSSALRPPLSIDAAILAVPSDVALQQAIQRVRGAGQVLLFAHTKRGAMTKLDLASVCVDEKDLLGSYSADFTLQREVARLIFSRQLDVRKLITHRYPLSEAAEAVRLAAHPTAESLKVVVVPD